MSRRITARTRLADTDRISAVRRVVAILCRIAAAARRRCDLAPPSRALILMPPTSGPRRSSARRCSFGAADGRGAEASGAVLEITRNLGKSLAVDEFLHNTLDTLFQIFPQADRGYILLAEEPSGRLTPRAVKRQPRRKRGVAHYRPHQPIGSRPSDDRRQGNPEQQRGSAKRKAIVRCLRSRSRR